MAVHVDRSLRLPKSEYFAMRQRKSGIALHHTVCDSARRTLDLWEAARTTGGETAPGRIRFEKRFIGIEITSEGGLTEHDGRLYACGIVSRAFETPTDEALD